VELRARVAIGGALPLPARGLRAPGTALILAPGAAGCTFAYRFSKAFRPLVGRVREGRRPSRDSGACPDRSANALVPTARDTPQPVDFMRFRDSARRCQRFVRATRTK